MLDRIVSFYRSGPDRPLLSGSREKISRLYERKRWSVLISAMIGYGIFYVCRINLAVVKKPMIDEGLLDPAQLGLMGSALTLVYAFGRFSNGILADRSNIRRFIPTGLLVSSLINLAIGFNSLFLVFLLLWALNGWFQSMGSAPCVVSLSHWFSNRERGTTYGIWGICHSIGEGLTYAGTAAVVAALGWRWGFWAPGLLCLATAGVLRYTLADRPQTYGLPPVADYKNDHGERCELDSAPIGQLQKQVLRDPCVWILALSAAFFSITRYGIYSWMVLYLQESKGYALADAGRIMAAYPVAGLFGTAFSGYFSDRFFNCKRSPPVLIFGVLQLVGLGLFYVTPPGHWALHLVILGATGFALGALLTYLGGLIAVDISHKRVSGTAIGLVGFLGYLGASVQDVVSGYLIKNHITITDGVKVYDFSYAYAFWVGATVVALALALSLWNVKAKE